MNRRANILNTDGTACLILEHVEPATGAPQSGYVVNGAWYWRREGTTEYALFDPNDPNDRAVTCTERPELHWVGIRYRATRLVRRGRGVPL